MQRVPIDEQVSSIRDFIGNLPMVAEGVALELNGRVVCRVFPAVDDKIDPQSLVRERWDLIRKAQQRTKEMPAPELEKAIGTAIDDVRARVRG